MQNLLADLFGINHDPLLGIEISSSSVKLLQLSKKNQELWVDNFALEPLAPGVVVEKNIKDRTALITALNKLLKKANVKSNLACIAVPGPAAITRIIQVSKELTEKEIANEIELEADRYIPYGIDEVNLDFEVLGPSAANDELVDVLLAVSKTENIAARVDVLSEVGLITKIVDIDTFAMERAFALVAAQLPDCGQDKVIALVDIGAAITTLNIFDNLHVVYTREQAFGGQQLITEIQKRYGLTFTESVMAREYGDLPYDYPLEVLEPFKRTIAQQVNRACQFFFSSGKYSEIDYLFLTGGTGIITGLDELIEEKLNVKTFIANPFAKMNIASSINVESLHNNAAMLMNCCGLALRNTTAK